ncbi:MAG: lactam utilization protein LamB [Cytophagaceae bacterium]|mgnify:CR=1 FL=1|nr:lactam utilization protein LamB [Cytophagaceae bacterium]|tara:strand:+ start:3643 stop:4374 length:732 start_codon:yes stop_codon:yes gene_type:complete
MIKQIDINCDLGEGVGNEAAIMPFISSCNIACGGHAGDAQSVMEVVALAKANGLKVGAHPSFPDKVNFGRKPMMLSADDLGTSLRKQILLVLEVCARENIKMNHVKPHGALYNLCAVDESLAGVVVDVLLSTCPKVVLFAPYGSAITKIAHGKVKMYYEAFADRNYNTDLTLVSRSQKDAMITEEKDIFNHVLMMVAGKIRVKSGEEIETKVDTICIHGDNPKAVSIARYLYSNLMARNIKIK